MTFATFAGSVIIVGFLIVEPNRGVAIAFAALGVLLQLRVIVQAGAEDLVKPRRERG